MTNEPTIRYTYAHGSMYYSLCDIERFFVYHDILKPGEGAPYILEVKKRLCRALIEKSTGLHLLDTLAIVPGDDFINHSNIWSLKDALPSLSNVTKAVDTYIFAAMTFNGVADMKVKYPDIFNVLREVKFYQSIAANQYDKPAQLAV